MRPKPRRRSSKSRTIATRHADILLAGLEHLDARYVKAVGYATKAPRTTRPNMVLLIDVVSDNEPQQDRTVLSVRTYEAPSRGRTLGSCPTWRRLAVEEAAPHGELADRDLGDRARRVGRLRRRLDRVRARQVEAVDVPVARLGEPLSISSRRPALIVSFFPSAPLVVDEERVVDLAVVAEGVPVDEAVAAGRRQPEEELRERLPLLDGGAVVGARVGAGEVVAPPEVAVVRPPPSLVAEVVPGPDRVVLQEPGDRRRRAVVVEGPIEAPRVVGTFAPRVANPVTSNRGR